MSRSQGYELIGIVWLALAAFDKHRAQRQG